MKDREYVRVLGSFDCESVMVRPYADSRHVWLTSSDEKGNVACVCLSPEQARELAGRLQEAAKVANSGGVVVV